MSDDAEELVEQAGECEDPDLAESLNRRAAELAPEWSVPRYNIGLICKYQGRWQESLEWNREAAALDPDDKAAWWNLGIAATAVGDWPEARRAWSTYGTSKLPPGDGPPDMNLGLTPVRLDPDGSGEVVWSHRIDPARARIESIPVPSSPHNHGDIVLTDGAIDGFRIVDGRKYPVFNVLALLSPSPLKKYVVELATSDAESIALLRTCADEDGGAAEDWGSTTHIICAQCSRGEPHAHGDKQGTPAHPHCGLAARDDDHAESIIRAWLARDPRADLIRWFDASASPE